MLNDDHRGETGFVQVVLAHGFKSGVHAVDDERPEAGNCQDVEAC
jgi:ribulose bisphosphate carboxylase small subunit